MTDWKLTAAAAAVAAWEGCGIRRFKNNLVFVSRDGRKDEKTGARKRYLYLIFLFPHKTRREFRRLFLPTALHNFFVSRGRATTRSSKLKKPVSRNDGWRFYRTVKTRPRPPGGRPAEHLNTPRCFVSFRNGRKNYSPGMTYHHPSGARWQFAALANKKMKKKKMNKQTDTYINVKAYFSNVPRFFFIWTPEKLFFVSAGRETLPGLGVTSLPPPPTPGAHARSASSFRIIPVSLLLLFLHFSSVVPSNILYFPLAGVPGDRGEPRGFHRRNDTKFKQTSGPSRNVSIAAAHEVR